MRLDPITALAIFAIWTLIAISVGCFIGKLIKLGTLVEEPYDWEFDQEHCETLTDDHLATWARVTVDEPETERDLGALADWACTVTERRAS